MRSKMSLTESVVVVVCDHRQTAHIFCPSAAASPYWIPLIEYLPSMSHIREVFIFTLTIDFLEYSKSCFGRSCVTYMFGLSTLVVELICFHN